MSSGRGGTTIDELLERIRNELPYVRAKYVMVTIGTNGGNTERKLCELVEYIRSQGAVPILNNIPCNEHGTQVETNELIERVRRRYAIPGLPLRSGHVGGSRRFAGRYVDDVARGLWGRPCLLSSSERSGIALDVSSDAARRSRDLRMRGRPVAVAGRSFGVRFCRTSGKWLLFVSAGRFEQGPAGSAKGKTDRMKCRCAGRNPGFGSAGSIGESAHDCTGEFRAGETGSCNPAGRLCRSVCSHGCFCSLFPGDGSSGHLTAGARRVGFVAGRRSLKCPA